MSFSSDASAKIEGSTRGKSRFLHTADGGKGIVSAAAESIGDSLVRILEKQEIEGRLS